MVTEPEPGFVPLSERLGLMLPFLRDEVSTALAKNAGLRAYVIESHLATLTEAIEALQMGELGSSQDHARAVSGGREDAPTWRPIDNNTPKDRLILLYGHLDPHENSRELYSYTIDRKIRCAGGWDEIDEAWSPVGATWLGPWFKPTLWAELPAPPTEEPTL